MKPFSCTEIFNLRYRSVPDSTRPIDVLTDVRYAYFICVNNTNIFFYLNSIFPILVRWSNTDSTSSFVLPTFSLNTLSILRPIPSHPVMSYFKIQFISRSLILYWISYHLLRRFNTGTKLTGIKPMFYWKI